METKLEQLARLQEQMNKAAAGLARAAGRLCEAAVETGGHVSKLSQQERGVTPYAREFAIPWPDGVTMGSQGRGNDG